MTGLKNFASKNFFIIAGTGLIMFAVYWLQQDWRWSKGTLDLLPFVGLRVLLLGICLLLLKKQIPPIASTGLIASAFVVDHIGLGLNHSRVWDNSRADCRYWIEGITFRDLLVDPEQIYMGCGNFAIP